jgi:hypothetical protein
MESLDLVSSALSVSRLDFDTDDGAPRNDSNVRVVV